MNPSALYRKALELMENGHSFSMAEVIWSSGSTPQKAGAMALFEANGSVWGTLGGGCLEAESRQRALEALDSGQARVFDLKLDEVGNWDDGLICGGRVCEAPAGMACAARDGARAPTWRGTFQCTL